MFLPVFVTKPKTRIVAKAAERAHAQTAIAQTGHEQVRLFGVQVVLAEADHAQCVFWLDRCQKFVQTLSQDLHASRAGVSSVLEFGASILVGGHQIALVVQAHFDFGRDFFYGIRIEKTST